nr:heme-binding protein [Martelella alba]
MTRRYLALSSGLPRDTGASATQRETPANGNATATPDELDFHLAHGLLCAALSAAGELSVAVVVAIADAHGNPVMTYRMPDSLLIALELAPKKAFSAVALKTATHCLGPVVQPGAELYQLETSSGGKIVTFGGGYPLYRAGRLVGGLGVSGGTAEQDRQIAERAVMHCHVGKIRHE